MTTYQHLEATLDRHFPCANASAKKAFWNIVGPFVFDGGEPDWHTIARALEAVAVASATFRPVTAFRFQDMQVHVYETGYLSLDGVQFQVACASDELKEAITANAVARIYFRDGTWHVAVANSSMAVHVPSYALSAYINQGFVLA